VDAGETVDHQVAETPRSEHRPTIIGGGAAALIFTSTRPRITGKQLARDPAGGFCGVHRPHRRDAHIDYSGCVRSLAAASSSISPNVIPGRHAG
jgi:hypothetical protein